jgi:hypothetical protein
MCMTELERGSALVRGSIRQVVLCLGGLPLAQTALSLSPLSPPWPLGLGADAA